MTILVAEGAADAAEPDRRASVARLQRAVAGARWTRASPDRRRPHRRVRLRRLSRALRGRDATFVAPRSARVRRADRHRCGRGFAHRETTWPLTVASGLCAAAGDGTILVSEAVRHIAGARAGAPMRPAGALRVPGIKAPLERRRGALGTTSLRPRAAGPQISVLIADDQQLVRTGFRVILEAEPDIRVVGEAADGREAVALTKARKPDVVLMDIRMPELDGLRAAEEIISDGDLPTAVVMLTTFDVGHYVYEALRVGASGFLLKDAPAARLLDAVRVAAAGDALIAPSITRRLIEQFARAAQPRPGAVPAALSQLTEREIDVLRLVARGLSNAEIAAELVLGENTIKTHVAHLLGKLGLRDRVQAVVLAYETGLVAPELAPAPADPAT